MVISDKKTYISGECHTIMSNAICSMKFEHLGPSPKIHNKIKQMIYKFNMRFSKYNIISALEAGPDFEKHWYRVCIVRYCLFHSIIKVIYT